MLVTDNWPAEALLDCTQLPQHTSGSVVCTTAAMYDDFGRQTWRFFQGERIHLFYEFAVLEDLNEALFGGAEIATERGIVVHGKSTIQYPECYPLPGAKGARLRIHQWFDLQLASGRYDVTIGLAGTNHSAFVEYVSGPLSFEELHQQTREHGRVVRVCSFEVAGTPERKLPYHGLTDLPGGAHTWHDIGDLPRAQASNGAAGPTIFHITHWKAGSQWVHKILRECVSARIIAPVVDDVQVRHYPIQRGSVYPTVYLAKREFDRVALPADSRVFVVIRDLRDTLISAYFSFKISHPTLTQVHLALREKLCSMDMQAGLWCLMEEFLPACADIQLSWLESRAMVVKYEELLERDAEILEAVLIEHCGLAVEPAALRRVVEQNRFCAVTGGRERGVEDRRAHERKGVAGDWRNYFTDELKKGFKARFGGLLVETGYEKDLSW